MLPVKDFDHGGYVFMATASGTVKKTPLVDFSRPRSTGIIAIDLWADDELVGVDLTDGKQDVMLFTSGGYVPWDAVLAACVVSVCPEDSG